MNTTAEHLTNGKQPTSIRGLGLVDSVVFLRATIVAIVIGSILTLVNQSGWIAGNEPLQVLQIFLVFLLPFAVVLVSQVVGIRQAYTDSAENTAYDSPESAMTTVVSHGIPKRSVIIGLFFGSVNAVLTLANAYLSLGDFSTVSAVPLAQAYALPLLFGLLSQTISYRRLRYQLFDQQTGHVRPAS